MSNKVKAQAKQIAKNSQNQVISQSISVARASILPPPDELDRYEKNYHGITKVLVDEFQAQSAHRRELEKAVIKADISSAKMGRIFSFVLALLSIIGGFLLIFFGKEPLGFGTIFLAIAALIGTSIYGQRARKEERLEKARMNP